MKHLLLFLALLLPAVAAAYDFEADGIYYMIDGDEVIRYLNVELGLEELD